MVDKADLAVVVIHTDAWNKLNPKIFPEKSHARRSCLAATGPGRPSLADHQNLAMGPL